MMLKIDEKPGEIRLVEAWIGHQISEPGWTLIAIIERSEARTDWINGANGGYNKTIIAPASPLFVFRREPQLALEESEERRKAVEKVCAEWRKKTEAAESTIKELRAELVSFDNIKKGYDSRCGELDAAKRTIAKYEADLGRVRELLGSKWFADNGLTGSK